MFEKYICVSMWLHIIAGVQRGQCRVLAALGLETAVSHKVGAGD